MGEANEELEKDKRSAMGMNDDDDDDDGINNAHHGIEQMTMDIGPFETKTPDEIVSMLKYILKHDKSSQTTKGFGLTALMKMRHKYELQDIDKDDKIDAILSTFDNDKQIEVQQRAIEFLSLFENTDKTARNKILKPMPIPKIERLFDESKSKKVTPEESDYEDDSSSSSTEIGSEKSSNHNSGTDTGTDSGTDTDKSNSSTDDDSRRRKRSRQKEKEKEKNKKEDKKRRDKKKNSVPVIPVLLPPDETMSASNGIQSP